MIKVANLSKSFDEEIIFSDFNLEIKSNSITVIMGESGSGKTTLLNMIAGIEKYDQGKITYDGVVLKNNVNFRRSDISIIFQNYALIENKSVYENLIIALKYVKFSKKQKYDAIVKELTKYGLEGHIDKKVYQLSGGQQQRVALIRAILKPCKYIFADEPTGNLDKENSGVIIDMFREISLEKTVIIVTHDSDFECLDANIVRL